MRGRKVRLKDEPSNYTIFYPYPCHQLPRIGTDILPGGCQTVSIDIAIKNFAICIEKRYNTGLIENVLFHRIDFTQYGNTSEYKGTTFINPQILNAATSYLNSIMHILKDSDIVGIERQMGINYKASAMFYYVLSYFMNYAPYFTKSCIIMDISPRLKGKMLDAPKGLNYTALKAWGIDKCIELLERRKDQTTLDILKKHRGRAKTKADDLADTVIQMEAWFMLEKGIVTQKPVTLWIQPSEVTCPTITLFLNGPSQGSEK